MISFGTIVPRFLSGTVKGERLFVWWIQSEDALAIPNSFYRVVLEALLLDRFICDLDRQMHRDHDHSLAITNEDVAGIDRDPAAAYRKIEVNRMVMDEICRRRSATAVNRPVHIADCGRVA